MDSVVWWVFLIVACGCLIGVALWIERKRRD
jgi:Mg2+ and Co2+ transporter CorA